MNDRSTSFDPADLGACRAAIMCFLLEQKQPYADHPVALNSVLTMLFADAEITEKRQTATLSMLRNLEIEELIISIPAMPPADGRSLIVHVGRLGAMFLQPNAWAEGMEAFYAQRPAINPYPLSLGLHADWLSGYKNAAAWRSLVSEGDENE